MIKGDSVPRDFSWIETYKLICRVMASFHNIMFFIYYSIYYIFCLARKWGRGEHGPLPFPPLPPPSTRPLTFCQNHGKLSTKRSSCLINIARFEKGTLSIVWFKIFDHICRTIILAFQFHETSNLDLLFTNLDLLFKFRFRFINQIYMFKFNIN